MIFFRYIILLMAFALSFSFMGCGKGFEAVKINKPEGSEKTEPKRDDDSLETETEEGEEGEASVWDDVVDLYSDSEKDKSSEAESYVGDNLDGAFSEDVDEVLERAEKSKEDGQKLKEKTLVTENINHLIPGASAALLPISEGQVELDVALVLDLDGLRVNKQGAPVEIVQASGLIRSDAKTFQTLVSSQKGVVIKAMCDDSGNCQSVIFNVSVDTNQMDTELNVLALVNYVFVKDANSVMGLMKYADIQRNYNEVDAKESKLAEKVSSVAEVMAIRDNSRWATWEKALRQEVKNASLKGLSIYTQPQNGKRTLSLRGVLEPGEEQGPEWLISEVDLDSLAILGQREVESAVEKINKSGQREKTSMKLKVLCSYDCKRVAIELSLSNDQKINLLYQRNVSKKAYIITGSNLGHVVKGYEEAVEDLGQEQKISSKDEVQAQKEVDFTATRGHEFVELSDIPGPVKNVRLEVLKPKKDKKNEDESESKKEDKEKVLQGEDDINSLYDAYYP